MTNPEPFLRAIWDHPDDDGPRLVYADWLDEQGQTARAEFIRVQCERHRLAWDVELGRAPATEESSRRLSALLNRQDELLKDHESTWLKDLPRLGGIEWGRFERGFIGAAAIHDTPALRRHAARVFAAAPVSRLLFRRLTRAGMRTLGVLPQLARVTEVDVTGGLGAGALPALLTASTWARLAVFRLAQNALTWGAVQALAGAELPALRSLHLEGARLDRASFHALTKAPWLPRLNHLNLTGNDLRDGGALAVAQADLSGLEWLSLGWNMVGDPGGRSLAASPRLENLRRLDLSGNPLRDSRERLWSRFGDRVRL